MKRGHQTSMIGTHQLSECAGSDAGGHCAFNSHSRVAPPQILRTPFTLFKAVHLQFSLCPHIHPYPSISIHIHQEHEILLTGKLDLR